MIGQLIVMALLLALNYSASWRLIKHARAAEPPRGIAAIVAGDVFLTGLLVLPLIPLSTVVRVSAYVLLFVLAAIRWSHARREQE